MAGVLVRLPNILDLGASLALSTEFVAAQGQSVRVDASDVERIGGLCLQVLIAAERKWRTDGTPFVIESPSEAYVKGVRLMVGADTLVSAR
jgi:chemotaxis protein CheX